MPKLATIAAGAGLIGIGLALSGPVALADDPPVIPEAGSESAAATISDLQAAGYDVRTQFENGTPDVDLDQCDVTDINTVGSAGSDMVAYVTITCPSNPS